MCHLHVVLKSSERTLLIHHHWWEQASLNNGLCAVAASVGDVQHHLGISRGVAWCQRPRFKFLSLSTADSQPRDFCKVPKIPKA